MTDMTDDDKRELTSLRDRAAMSRRSASLLALLLRDMVVPHAIDEVRANLIYTEGRADRLTARADQLESAMKGETP
jgi:hypothetical protein